MGFGGTKLDGHIEEVRVLLEEGLTNTQIGDKFGASEKTVRRAIDGSERLQAAAKERSVRRTLLQSAEAVGVKKTEDGITITDAATWETRPISTLTVEQLLERHGLDPEEWEVKNTLVNQWEANAGEGTKIPLFQFKVWFVKKVPLKLIYPATVGPKIKAPKKPDGTSVELGIIVTDHQTPHVNWPLHELTLRWLAKNRPAFGVVGGDLQDHGYIGRHRDDPAWDATAQECIDSAFKVLWDYRNADEDTFWSLIKGNHDDRVRNEQLERNERLYGVHAAQWPGDEPEEYVYSLNHLLHLKELGFEYVEPKGTYEFEQVPLTDILTVRHGHKAAKGYTNAINTANELGHSIIMGHTHRQNMVRETKWNSVTGKYNVITGIEAGCMCNIEGGLGFANAGCPDWQPGFVTVTRFPDSNFTFDFAVYEQPGVLRWRDQVYTI